MYVSLFDSNIHKLFLLLFSNQCNVKFRQAPLLVSVDLSSPLSFSRLSLCPVSSSDSPEQLNHPPLFVLAAALVSHYQADLDDNFAISSNPCKFTKYKFQTEEFYFYCNEENT